MKLYYVPNTRAVRVRWLLEEMGVPYELVRLDPAKGETKSPEYLAVNPLGRVPALTDGDITIAESAAICAYLADKFPETELAPAPGSAERGAYFQWLFFGMAMLEPLVDQHFKHTRTLPEPERSVEAADRAKKTFATVVAPLERHLATNEFLVGGRFSAADAIIGHLAMWARRTRMYDGTTLPGLEAYANRLRERPAFQRASAD